MPPDQRPSPQLERLILWQAAEWFRSFTHYSLNVTFVSGHYLCYDEEYISWLLAAFEDGFMDCLKLCTRLSALHHLLDQLTEISAAPPRAN